MTLTCGLLLMNESPLPVMHSPAVRPIIPKASGHGGPGPFSATRPLVLVRPIPGG
jgi:hypothetical protein